jgi:hypothetical protein
MNFNVSQIVAFLSAILVVFLIYRRLRRSFGQQLLRPVRMQVRIGLLILVAALLLPIALRSAAFLFAMRGGARTRFLEIDNRLYYVPHTYTGIAVSLLFLGRLVYRLIQVYADMHATHAAAAPAGQTFAPAGMVNSPLTLGLFFALVGYYVCYYSIVLWKSNPQRRVITTA